MAILILLKFIGMLIFGGFAVVGAFVVGAFIMFTLSEPDIEDKE